MQKRTYEKGGEEKSWEWRKGWRETKGLNSGERREGERERKKRREGGKKKRRKRGRKNRREG
eukprot:1934647-Pleurochrysis_carterae.AAC.1